MHVSSKVTSSFFHEEEDEDEVTEEKEDSALRKRPRAEPPPDLKSLAMRAMVSDAFDQDADKFFDNLFRDKGIRQAAEKHLLGRKHSTGQLADRDPIEIVYSKLSSRHAGGQFGLDISTSVFNKRLCDLPHQFRAVLKQQHMFAMSGNIDPEDFAFELDYDPDSNVFVLHLEYAPGLPDWVHERYSDILLEMGVRDAVSEHFPDHSCDDSKLEPSDSPFPRGTLQDDAWRHNFETCFEEEDTNVSNVSDAWEQLWKTVRKMQKKQSFRKTWHRRRDNDAVHQRRPRLRIMLLDDQELEDNEE